MTATAPDKPEADKVAISSEQLAEYLKLAKSQGTVWEWCDLAVNWATNANAELVRMHSALTADAKDAARYRWLRKHGDLEGVETETYTVDVLVWEPDGTAAYEAGFGETALDIAVDLAMENTNV